MDNRRFGSACQFTSCFAALFGSNPGGSPEIKLRKHPATGRLYQQFCLKYLISSSVVFGRVEEEDLSAIHEFCKVEEIEHLSSLSNELLRDNSFDTIVRYIAASIHRGSSSLGDLIMALMKDDWDVVKPLIAKVLAILADGSAEYDTYYSILRHLPVERQKEMIDAGEMSLGIISSIYSIGKFEPFLRELFALARCSYNPNLEIRQYIANRFPHFRQHLANGTVKNIVIPCPANIPMLNTDTWLCVSRFLDAETLAFVWPLVCRTWRDLYSKILACSTKVHDMYLEDLNHVDLSAIHTIAPWAYCLSSEANALEYLRYCMTDNTLDDIRLNESLQCKIKKYLMDVMEGSVPLPRIRNCISPYDSFVRLFEMVYEFCTCDRPNLDRPVFLTDEEYEQAVHYFVCQKGWILKLPRLLAVGGLPRLFSIIDENEELMKRLIAENFTGFAEAAVVLMLHKQSNDVTRALARLIFSQTDLFKRLAELEFISHSEYYNFIIESDALPQLIVELQLTTRFSSFMASLILFFKDRPDKIEGLLKLICSRFPNTRLWLLRRMRLGLEGKLTELSSGAADCSSDVRHLKGIMAEYGLLRESEL